MSNPQHIAVVDDETQIRAAVGEYLELHGFHVSTADGGAALRGIMAGTPAVDLVILDLNLPGEDGLTIARNLREHSHVGIIILTAAGQTLDRIVGLEVGADDYMAKPFDLRELLARVKSVLRRIPADTARATRQEKNATIQFGELTLHTRSHSLTDSSGRVIPLTSMEYDLLRALAEAPNRAFTREQLLERAHRHDGDPFDRSIDVRIARLRRKIEKNPSKPRFIKTVRGVGYLFAPEPEKTS
jgi:DNA-binding response OmpR family regulator